MPHAVKGTSESRSASSSRRRLAERGARSEEGQLAPPNAPFNKEGGLETEIAQDPKIATIINDFKDLNHLELWSFQITSKHANSFGLVPIFTILKQSRCEGLCDSKSAPQPSQLGECRRSGAEHRCLHCAHKDSEKQGLWSAQRAAKPVLEHEGPALTAWLPERVRASYRTALFAPARITRLLPLNASQREPQAPQTKRRTATADRASAGALQRSGRGPRESVDRGNERVSAQHSQTGAADRATFASGREPSTSVPPRDPNSHLLARLKDFWVSPRRAPLVTLRRRGAVPQSYVSKAERWRRS
jgi:hypothetical protein